METIAQVMERERTRLKNERDKLVKKQNDIQTQLDELDKELAAIDAYENTKTGKPKTTKPRGERRAGVRDKVLEAVKNKAGTSAEIRTALGIAEDDKSGSQSVANALSALKRANKIKLTEEGKYEALT